MNKQKPDAGPRLNDSFTVFFLTAWNWTLFEKTPAAQLLKNFPTFYGTLTFITVFIRASQWGPS
jgi:hypothetical protein